MYGKRIRMSKIIKPECGKGVVLPYAHGILTGPVKGLMTLAEMKRCMKLFRESGVTGIIICADYMRYFCDYFAGANAPSPIFLIDWCNLIYDAERRIGPDKISSRLFLSIEKAVRYGAVGVMIYLLMGHDDPETDAKEVRKCAAVVEECERYGLPVIIEPCMGSIENQEKYYSVKYIQKNARIASELGADIVKSHYTGDTESFKQVVDTCPTPIMVAGGPKSRGISETKKFITGVMEAGAAGIIVGRKLFQTKDPVKFLKMACEIVYNRESHH